MATLIAPSKGNQAAILPVVLVAAYIQHSDPNQQVNISVEDKVKTKDDLAELKVASGTISGTSAIVKHFTSLSKPLQQAKESLVDEWISDRLSPLYASEFKAVEPHLQELDAHLLLRSYIVGYSLSAVDLAFYGAIRGNRPAAAAIKKGNLTNLTRWYRFIEETNSDWLPTAVHLLTAAASDKKAAKAAAGASYDIALKDTEKGVVTRFPPEPSGYLHIGHAKAALLNDYFAHEAYPGGKLICRFDDTNPSKEKQEFQDAIIEDLAMMGIRPDTTTYSSDYFQEMYEMAVKMIKEGKAYADDTPLEKMRAERMDGIESARRNESVETNLAKFEEMKKASTEGQTYCIRAKVSVDNPNKAMRDPVIYRCNLQPHHRTGDAWKMYPTYDFCVPIVDALEGVTHSLRTIEYRDRNPQYEWMQEALGVRKVHIWDFARMNFVRTFLSKRKLTKFVDKGLVWGWDDPRFPTVRGVRRRGMTVGALREFILKQGPSRNITTLDWTAFWATNKKYIDPVAPRHTAVISENAVKCTIKGARTAPYSEDRPKHPKNPDVGTKKVTFSNQILIEQEDAAALAEGEEITLMGWGNAITRNIKHSLNPLKGFKTVTEIELELHLQGDFKTTEKKITWLADAPAQELIPVELVDFDYLITKDKLEEDDDVFDFVTPKSEWRTAGLADSNVAELKMDDIIQFERKGYFRVDRAFKHGEPAVLFSIPTGKQEKK